MSIVDPDDWAKEDCSCGHRRYAHRDNIGALASGACTRAGCTCKAFAEYAPDEPWDY